MNETIAITDITRRVEDALSAAASAAAPDKKRLREILDRAGCLKGLPLADSAALLAVEDPEGLAALFEAAGKVKEAVFGPRVVLFAPLYLSNYCSNDCVYCGFRRSNASARRKALSPEEALVEARALSAAGFKRLLLVAGEHAGKSSVDYLAEVARAIYEGSDIRILHVNCAPQETEGFRRLKAAGFGVYQCFQETYNEAAYARFHPAGRKSDYRFRLAAMDRALEAGFGDVGIGALLGLYDYRYDVLATIAHSKHLEESFGAAAHTISVPRLRHAQGAALTEPPSPVGDTEFKKAVAVYRLSVPYAGVVISTREPAALRDELLLTGASQVSAGSSTEPGGYTNAEHSATQFDVDDTRSLTDMVEVIARMGLLPSLCTSCYRSGRQGADFREIAATGAIKDFCTPNAILSLAEYLAERPEAEASAALLGETIKKFTETVEEPLRRDLARKLSRVDKGDKDVRY